MAHDLTDALVPTPEQADNLLYLVPARRQRGPYRKANKRKRRAHPGVTIAQRGKRWALVYRDREAGDTKQRERRLPARIDSFEKAHAEALLVCERLEGYKLALINGTAKAPVTSPLSQLVHDYVVDLRDVKDRSPRTAAQRLVTLNELIVWAHAREIFTLEALTAEKLGEWNTYATTRPSTRPRDKGRKRSVTSVDQDRKYVHAFIGWCRRTKRVGKHLDDDVLTETIPLQATKGGKKNKRPVRVLTVAELRRILRAALEHDRMVPHDEAVAPDLTVMLLTALRREEYALTRVRHLELDVASPFDTSTDAPTIDYIDLPGEIAKHGNPRKVYFTAFTALGLELVREMAAGRAGDEWLSEHSYWMIGAALDRLTVHQAPKFSPKDLRSTCCSYETRLEIAGNTAALNARQGHTERVRLDSYTDSVVGLSAPKRYVTLEAAMGIELEVRAVIEALRARKRAHGSAPRRGERSKKMPKQRAVVGLSASA